ncbi:MAG: glycosyltransferase family 87 protein [Terracidiphilus sp.]|jgi:hypothetical protein
MQGEIKPAINVRRLVTLLAFGLLALMMVRAAYIPLAEAFTRGGAGLDFRCYYAAAWMVRGHSSEAIYSEIGKDVDPTETSPDPNSIFARTAKAHGVPDVYAYVYPPTLADLLVPFTFVSVSTALHAWYVLNIAALAGAGIFFVRTPGQELSRYVAPFIFYLFVSTPTVDCLLYGQVPILLLFLMVCGINLYVRGNKYSAGLFFALAAAIKLTPLVVVIPLIAWGDWKYLRAIAFWCVVIAGILLAVNGPGALDLYFFHVLPSMGSTAIDTDSRSLNTVVRVLWTRSETGIAPPGVIWVGKALSALAVCFAGWLSYPRHDDSTGGETRVETIAIFLFLSCCVAPVSWRHAYLLAAPALLFLGKRAWEGQSTIFEDAMFATFIVAVTTNRFLEQPLLTPLSGIVLCFLALYRLRDARLPARIPHERVEVPAG